jgi:hypothetical protein
MAPEKLHQPGEIVEIGLDMEKTFIFDVETEQKIA